MMQENKDSKVVRMEERIKGAGELSGRLGQMLMEAGEMGRYGWDSNGKTRSRIFNEKLLEAAELSDRLNANLRELMADAMTDRQVSCAVWKCSIEKRCLRYVCPPCYLTASSRMHSFWSVPFHWRCRNGAGCSGKKEKRCQGSGRRCCVLNTVIPQAVCGTMIMWKQSRSRTCFPCFFWRGMTACIWTCTIPAGRT